MKRYTFILLSLLAVSCAEDLSTGNMRQDTALPIEIASNYPVSLPQTRASIENGFVADDAVGIFVVDYDKEGNSGTPAVQGERAGNIKFTYDGTHWTANYQLYWKNSTTPADFYGYYPYDQEMESVTDYAFTISRRQDATATNTAAAGYEQSDLLWAKTTKVMPTSETVSLSYRHLMAGLCVQLQKGSGFTDSEWTTLDKIVQIENTVLNGTVNLQTGAVTTVGTETEVITPLLYGDGQGEESFRAVVFPQTVSPGKPIVSVTIDGKTYPMVKEVATTYLSGKMQNMTITVNKSTATGDYELALTADDIVAWVDAPALHDGLVRQYTVVTLKEAGTLKEEIDMISSDYARINNLKVIGPMNRSDREFISGNLKNLRCLNLQLVDMKDGILSNLNGLSLLQHFIFPAKGIWKIGQQAFYEDPLMGQLVIPEGVTDICQYAFRGSQFTGTLTLPSTLKRLEADAFGGNTFTGELRLPEGLEYVYAPTGQFSGNLYFPPSLKTVKDNWGYSQMTGTITIPACLTTVGDNSIYFLGSGCTQVEFHDGITEIGRIAFRYSSLTGELDLPSNLKSIGQYAFEQTRISKIIFPEALRILDNYAFANCYYLTGTLELPKHVALIPQGCFQGCKAITGLHIPEGVDVIANQAFAGCVSLNSIVCEAKEPPALFDDAFELVPRDNFTVEVPKGCVEKYREAPGWREFKRISEYSNFVCRPMQANALNTAHTEQLVLNADGPWTVKSKPDWVTLSKNDGTGKTMLTLTFQQMEHGAGNRADTIRFKMPEEGHETFCVVSQYDYQYEEDSYIALQEHSKGRGIDIIFIGDGYDGEDISNGNYLSLVQEQTEHFFDLEPYKSHRDYFNVYVTFPLSQEKGVNTMNTYVNNHFGSLYGFDPSLCVTYQLLTDLDEVRQYALDHTPLTRNVASLALIIFVPNSDAYMGDTFFERNASTVSICPASSRPYPQDTRGVVQHEAGGHGFGRLGDEAIIRSAWAPSSVKATIEDKHRNGEFANLATTSSLHSVPWADFVFDTRYSDQVDVYEGGYEYMRGIFRPEQNSCMNYGIPYYNAPSRLSIMQRIFDYAGERFSMDYFYMHDSNAWGNTGQTRQTSHIPDYSGSSYGASNQHCQPLVTDGKVISSKVRKIRQAMKAKQTVIK